MQPKSLQLLLLFVCAAAAAAGLSAGCASNKPNERPTYVPLDAGLAASGAASISTLAYPGQAYYVTDDDRHALVFSSRVPLSTSGAMIVKIDRERKPLSLHRRKIEIRSWCSWRTSIPTIAIHLDQRFGQRLERIDDAAIRDVRQRTRHAALKSA
jgi:hypothetical protein